MLAVGLREIFAPAFGTAPASLCNLNPVAPNQISMGVKNHSLLWHLGSALHPHGTS